MSAPRRPVLRWHGGKWRLAPFVLAHFPPHRVYVEAYGGAASVLIRKPRSYAEIYNDLDGLVVNLFKILRGSDMNELLRRLTFTPFARCEFEDAYEISNEPIEEARRLVVRSFMGFGSDGFNRNVRTGFRANSNRSGTTPAHDWVNLPDNLRAVAERFQGVVIECREALDVVAQHDSDDTLHYLDPPYVPATRSDKSRKSGGAYHAYVHEMSAADHVQMLSAAREIRGSVVISGYPSSIYDEALKDWHRVTCEALADGALKRTEVLWINPRALERMGRLI